MSDYVGKRVSVRDSIATVRYHGPVDGTSGSWLGIEWDDPSRGKHDGSKDGKTYFTCRFPTSGSFVRLSHTLNFGIPFLDALLQKYVENVHGSEPETVLLGSSKGAIQVEAVNLDKIRAKFSDIHRLKEVSLDGEMVSSAGLNTTDILHSCPNLRGLDLSRNLLPDWPTISLITANLPSLQRLALNQNRFAPHIALDRQSGMNAAFQHLQELQLNETLIDWNEMQVITSLMPQLNSLELGYNRLAELTQSPSNTLNPCPPLRSLNLDSNQLSNWANIISGLAHYDFLQRVVLTSNGLATIPFWAHGSPILAKLTHLSLASNFLKEWADLDNLPSWCPSMESLSIVGNPLITDHELAHNSRSFIIARVPSLTSLDGTAISTQERNDSEIYYLSYLSRSGLRPDILEQCHPQRIRLNEKHGLPIDNPSLNTEPHQPHTLRSDLFQLNIHISPPSVDLEETKFHPSIFKIKHVMNVLPTMSLNALRLKISKALRKTGVSGRVGTLWIRMNQDELAELDDSNVSQDLSWLGLEDSSDIVVTIIEKQ